MKASPFFKNLFSLYDAEINDLTTDSSGANILASRLAQKRKQLELLMPMIAFSSEMVAPVFHGAFHFKAFRKMEQVIRNDGQSLPDWATVAGMLDLAPWAEPLVKTALAADGGEAFLVQTAALEFLFHHHDSDAYPAPAADPKEAKDPNDALDSGSDADEPSESGDLAESGDEWMSEQGFDRLG